MMYYVQETIGGWKQVAVFQGTYDECLDYMEQWCFNGNWRIVNELDYQVDYL